jgi:hypothetical protein
MRQQVTIGDLSRYVCHVFFAHIVHWVCLVLQCNDTVLILCSNVMRLGVWVFILKARYERMPRIIIPTCKRILFLFTCNFLRMRKHCDLNPTPFFDRCRVRQQRERRKECTTNKKNQRICVILRVVIRNLEFHGGKCIYCHLPTKHRFSSCFISEPRVHTL